MNVTNPTKMNVKKKAGLVGNRYAKIIDAEKSKTNPRINSASK